MSGYSEIKLVTLPKFRMARYVMITPQPENDVIAYMNKWAKDSGLLDVPGYKPRQIGWDFPYVSEIQQKQFGLRGYVAAYVIPEDFQPKCRGAEITYADECKYVTLTIEDPHSDSETVIGGGYQALLDYVQSGKAGCSLCSDERHTCVEEEYERGGVQYMDVYVPVV